MVVFYFAEVADELVDLLLTDFESMVKLLVHHLSQLKLLRGTQLIERILAFVKDLFFTQDRISVLEAVLQQSCQFILFFLLLLVKFVHFKEQYAGRS